MHLDNINSGKKHRKKTGKGFTNNNSELEADLIGVYGGRAFGKTFLIRNTFEKK